MYKIAQITDIHITSKGELLRGEVDTRSRLINTLRDIRKYGPDAIVFSGDLAAINGSEEIYSWIRNTVNDIKCEIYFIPGNHDDVMLMKRNLKFCQPLTDEELFFYFDKESFRITFLDSSKEILSAKQINWVRKIHNETEKDLILFVHHPLDLCGCHHMDRKYPLKNIPDVKSLIKECGQIKYIFSGHYHIEKYKKIYQATQFLTPSTVFQIFPEPEGCVADYVNYGWRIIELDDDKLNTKVKYLK